MVEAKNRLGEGPVWDHLKQSLFWFDIKAAELWRLDAEGRTERWSLPGMSSVAARLEGTDDLLIVGQSGLLQFDPLSGAATALSDLEIPPGFRTNDGKVDPQGRLWWSTMDDAGGARPGAVHRLEGMDSTAMIDGVHIANSIAFSPEGDRLYLSDSARRTLWMFPLDEAGRPGAREVFATWTHGEPDGAATDATGALWVAVWGGSRIDHFSAAGRLIESIPLPVSQPTSCAFGGPDLTTLYVTSARIGLSDEAVKREPLAGGVFALETETPGAAIPPLAV